MDTQLAQNIIQAYSEDRWGLEYGYRSGKYTQGYHRGQDIRHSVGTHSVVTDVFAVQAGTVVYVGRPNKLLGLTIVIDTGRKTKRFESHSHLAIPLVKKGQKVLAGQKLARNAAMNENPGLIDGPHDHITYTDVWNGAWMTLNKSYDPMPMIKAALATARAALSKEEEEMPDIIAVNFKKTQPQVFLNDKTDYLRINDANDATALTGPAVLGSGVLSLSGVAEGDGPFDSEGFVPVIQVQPVIDKVVDGKTTTRNLGVAVEVVVTQGLTSSNIPIPPATLQTGDRLRFRITPRARKSFSLRTTSARLTVFRAGK